MVGKVIRNLRIVSELGKGGMGVVYLAEHVILRKRFAVKSLSPQLTSDPQFSERFFQEAMNQALLDHPNIVQAIDFFEEEGQFFLVMEYVEGKDLGDLIKEKGRLSEREGLKIFKEVLSGVASAHRKGMVHRDIKPSNILVEGTGRVRIMDFGIAILAGDKRLTGTGINVGSAAYMSPEQIQRPQGIDNRSDIYALGIVLFEMLTGDLPFRGDTDFTVKSQQVTAPVPDPVERNPEIPRKLSQLMVKAMAKAPEERFQSCEEFLEAIEAYERPAAAPLQREERPQGARAMQVRMLAGAALVVASGVLALHLFNRTAPSSHEAAAPGGVAGAAAAAPAAPAPAPPSAEAQGAAAAVPATLPAGEQFTVEQRRAVTTLIKGGIEQASMICMETGRMELAKQSLHIAQSNGFSKEASDYQKAIGIMKQNIDDRVAAYNEEILAVLAGSNHKLLQEQLDEYESSLQSKKKEANLVMLGLMRRHCQQYEGTQTRASLSSFNDFCVARQK